MMTIQEIRVTLKNWYIIIQNYCYPFNKNNCLSGLCAFSTQDCLQCPLWVTEKAAPLVRKYTDSLEQQQHRDQLMRLNLFHWFFLLLIWSISETDKNDAWTAWEKKNIAYLLEWNITIIDETPLGVRKRQPYLLTIPCSVPGDTGLDHRSICDITFPPHKN